MNKLTVSSSDLHHHGSLFTLFLHSPLTALCYICNVGDVAIHHWERCQSYIDRFVTEASRLVTRCRMDDIEQGSGFIGNGFDNSIWRGRTLTKIIRRFIVRSILWWWLPANIDSSFCVLWCDDAAASKFSWETSAAALWTTTASCRTLRASVTSPHRTSASHSIRRTRTFFWSRWGRMMRENWNQLVIVRKRLRLYWKQP